MTPLADWLARRTWWACLWFIRRPWVRRLQRFSTDWRRNPDARARARAGLIRQEQFARRHGLRVLRVTYLVCLYVIALQIAYVLAVNFLPTVRPE